MVYMLMDDKVNESNILIKNELRYQQECLATSSSIRTYKCEIGRTYTVYDAADNGENIPLLSFKNPLRITNTEDHSVPQIINQDLDYLNEHSIVMNVNKTGPSTSFASYKLVYRFLQNSNAKWKQEVVSTNNGKIVLPNLNSDTNYEIKIARICDSFAITGFSESYFGKTIFPKN